MSRALFCFVVLASTLAAGCAGNRDTLADPSTAAVPTATATSTASASTLAAAPAAQAAPDGATIVDGNLLAARTADTLLCRDLLVRGSNQMRRQCGTAAQWKTYERREAELAGEMLRRMQNARPDPDYPARRR